MKMILIKNVVFLSHIYSFNQLQQSLNNLSPNKPEMKGKSVVSSNYLSQYWDFLQVIKEYSNLLDKDIKLMEKSERILFEQDELIGNTIGNQVK